MVNSALIGFSGVCIGALLSFLSNLVISRRQSESHLKSVKIEILERKISKLESSLNEYTKVSFDINGISIPPMQMIGNGMLLFTQRCNVTKNIHYLLPEELVNEMNEVNAEIDGLIFKVKTRENAKFGKEDVLEIQDTFKKVQDLDGRLAKAISSELKKYEIEIEKEIG